MQKFQRIGDRLEPSKFRSRSALGRAIASQSLFARAIISGQCVVIPLAVAKEWTRRVEIPDHACPIVCRIAIPVAPQFRERPWPEIVYNQRRMASPLNSRQQLTGTIYDRTCFPIEFRGVVPWTPFTPKFNNEPPHPRLSTLYNDARYVDHLLITKGSKLSYIRMDATGVRPNRKGKTPSVPMAFYEPCVLLPHHVLAHGLIQQRAMEPDKVDKLMDMAGANTKKFGNTLKPILPVELAIWAAKVVWGERSMDRTGLLCGVFESMTCGAVPLPRHPYNHPYLEVYGMTDPRMLDLPSLPSASQPSQLLVELPTPPASQRMTRAKRLKAPSIGSTPDYSTTAPPEESP
jgi:hypothetical protein